MERKEGEEHRERGGEERKEYIATALCTPVLQQHSGSRRCREMRRKMNQSTNVSVFLFLFPSRLRFGEGDRERGGRIRGRIGVTKKHDVGRKEKWVVFFLVLRDCFIFFFSPSVSRSLLLSFMEDVVSDRQSMT